jgi:hypothetical protein
MLILPDQIVRAKHKNPRTILIYTKPKKGKTTLLAGLTGLLLVDSERGSELVDALIIQVNNFEELREAAAAIYKKGYNETTKIYTPFYTYIALDTLTRIDEWSEIEGTFRYMDKPQGKKFNRENENPLGRKIMPWEPEFETVHEIGQGFGYRYSRDVVIKFFETFNTLAPHIIYVCHVKDKFVGTTNSGAEILTKEINLTGKLKDIIASKVDIIAVGDKEQNKLVLSFVGDSGSRCSHLSGKKVTVSEMFPITKEEFDKVKAEINSPFERFMHNNSRYEHIKISDSEHIYQRLDYHWDRIFLK